MKHIKVFAKFINESSDLTKFTYFKNPRGIQTSDLKKSFTIKSTYDPGMSMICPKDLNDKSDRHDGMLGYIYSLTTLEDKSLYPLNKNHPDYGKLIIMTQSTKDDLNNLLKELGSVEIELRPTIE